MRRCSECLATVNSRSNPIPGQQTVRGGTSDLPIAQFRLATFCPVCCRLRLSPDTVTKLTNKAWIIVLVSFTPVALVDAIPITAFPNSWVFRRHGGQLCRRRIGQWDCRELRERVRRHMQQQDCEKRCCPNARVAIHARVEKCPGEDRPTRKNATASRFTDAVLLKVKKLKYMTANAHGQESRSCLKLK